MPTSARSLLLAAFPMALLGTAPSASASTAPPAPPRAEARAVWVNRWEYSSPAGVARIMENARRAHLNLVYFQVRGAADAYYRSDLEPCAARLCGTLGAGPAPWDPLEVAVREAHARGLELHAWLNALAGWESRTASGCRVLQPSPPGQPQHILVRHPEWTMYRRDRAPQSCPNGDEYVYLSPAHPGVRTELARVAADLVRRYDVDGIHLDRIRYPGGDFGWDPASLAAFGRDPAADPAGWAAFRRGLVNRMVQETRDSVDAVRSGVALSAAVWPIYDRRRFGWPSSSGVGQFFQDTWEWARAGYLDVAVPMTYFYIAERPCSYLPRRRGLEPNPDWDCMVKDHVAGMRPSGRQVYAGVLASLPRAEIARQIEAGRADGVDGFSFYSYGDLESADLWSFLAQGPFRDAAVVPRMAWKAAPAAPATGQ